MDAKKAIGSGTGTLVGLSASVFLQSQPTWASQHPHWVNALYVATVLFGVFTALQFSWIQRVLGLQAIAPPPVPDKNVEADRRGIAVEGDVSNSSLDSSSGTRIIGDSAIEAILRQSKQVALPPRTPSPLPLLKPRPRWIDAAFEDYPGQWVKVAQQHPSAVRMAICSFENPPAPRDGNGTLLNRVEARLKFAGYLDSVHPEIVNTAYWLNSDSNQMNIPAGHERIVVIGNYENSERFISYENKYSYHNTSDFTPFLREQGEVTIPAPGNIRVEITLTERASSDRTVETIIVEIDVQTHAIKVVDL